jgi:hypothetical protein
VPPLQVWVAPQVMPHLPQFMTSVFMSTHEPAQMSGKVSWQEQLPSARWKAPGMHLHGFSCTVAVVIDAHAFEPPAPPVAVPPEPPELPAVLPPVLPPVPVLLPPVAPAEPFWPAVPVPPLLLLQAVKLPAANAVPMIKIPRDKLSLVISATPPIGVR